MTRQFYKFMAFMYALTVFAIVLVGQWFLGEIDWQWAAAVGLLCGWSYRFGYADRIEDEKDGVDP